MFSCSLGCQWCSSWTNVFETRMEKISAIQNYISRQIKENAEQYTKKKKNTYVILIAAKEMCHLIIKVHRCDRHRERSPI